MKSEKENIDLPHKAILDSLGLLDEKEAAQLRDEIKVLSPDEKKTFADFNNIVSLLPLASFKEDKSKTPSEKVKDKIFAKLDKRSQNENTKNDESFGFIHSDSGEWIDHPVEGIKFKQLAVNTEKGYVMILMRVAAGTYYPAHHHHGAEECYVVEGDVYAQGKTLGPGDFHHAGGGSDHEPLYTKNGCTLILVVDKDDF